MRAWVDIDQDPRGRITMSVQSTGSHPVLSHADSIAAGLTDFLLLVGRWCIVAVLLMTAWGGSPTAGYLGSLGVSNPGFWSTVAICVEYVCAFSLVFGIATRYGALLGIAYVIVATALAHRYWEYPQAQQVAQYTNFLKNISIFGGLLMVFVNGGGRFSVDHKLSEKD
jgi:putative oxidoreductase